MNPLDLPVTIISNLINYLNTYDIINLLNSVLDKSKVKDAFNLEFYKLYFNLK